MVSSHQTFGEYAAWHPHWHTIVLEGGCDRYDRFYFIPIGASESLRNSGAGASLSSGRRNTSWMPSWLDQCSSGAIHASRSKEAPVSTAIPPGSPSPCKSFALPWAWRSAAGIGMKIRCPGSLPRRTTSRARCGISTFCVRRHEKLTPRRHRELTPAVV